MLQFLKHLLGLTLIILLGFFLYRAATKNANESLKTLRVSPDSTVTVVGAVLANNTGCFNQTTGSKCFLKVRVGEKEVYVVYNTNDSSFCANEKAATNGGAIREHQTVKIFGFYKKEGEADTILTCPSSQYSIQTL